MNYIFLGKIVNTHGIKGELKIKSDFERKNLVFKKDKSLIIDNKDFIIKSYRVHECFDLVTFYDLEDINLVLNLKGKSVYFDRDLLKLNEDDYLYDDLLGMNIYLNDECIGKAVDYENTNNPLLHVVYNNKKYYIPLKGNFITNVDLSENKIHVNEETRELMLWKLLF